MTRRTTATAVVIFVVGLLALDLAAAEPPDIYAQPPTIALGSGMVVTGAHCAALPTE